MKNIAIFGGSFNPPTIAHKKIINEVLEKTDIKKIILLPSGERDDKDHKIDLSHRKRLISIFYEDLKNIGVNIELENHFLEGKNGGDTTTAQEEEYLRNKLGFSPYFIYGSDIAPAMPNRTGNKNKFIEKKLKKIFIIRSGYKFDAEKYNIENYELLKGNKIPNISSTIVRENILKKQNIENYVIPEISDYIKENGLYL